MSSDHRVCLAAIVGAHGVRGLVRLKPFTEESESVAAYGPLSDESGERHFQLRLKGQVKGLLLAEIDGVADRNAAEALRGLRLYVERAALPPPEDPEEFYYADLIGLRVETSTGELLGEVRAVQDFGAGDVLEVAPAEDRSFYLPFTRQVVPKVELAAGRLIADPPAEVTAEAAPRGAASAVAGQEEGGAA